MLESAWLQVDLFPKLFLARQLWQALLDFGRKTVAAVVTFLMPIALLLGFRWELRLEHGQPSKAPLASELALETWPNLVRPARPEFQYQEVPLADAGDRRGAMVEARKGKLPVLNLFSEPLAEPLSEPLPEPLLTLWPQVTQVLQPPWPYQTLWSPNFSILRVSEQKMIIEKPAQIDSLD